MKTVPTVRVADTSDAAAVPDLPGIELLFARAGGGVWPDDSVEPVFTE